MSPLTGSSSSARLEGGNGNDVINGNDVNDTLIGGFGNDIIVGGAQADNIQAGNGDDIIFSGAGLDTVSLGAGSDTVVLVSGIGYDTINNFQLQATQFQVSSLDNLRFANSADGARILQENDLLAMVSGQSANTISGNVSDIFVVV